VRKVRTIQKFNYIQIYDIRTKKHSIRTIKDVNRMLKAVVGVFE